MEVPAVIMNTAMTSKSDNKIGQAKKTLAGQQTDRQLRKHARKGKVERHDHTTSIITRGEVTSNYSC
jgi:hypothetical protein